MKTTYQIVSLLLLFMIGLLACGIPEFLGSSEENSPTSPCFERIPTPTLTPTPAPALTPTLTPNPRPPSVTDYTIAVSYSDPDSCGGNIDPPGSPAPVTQEVYTVSAGSSRTFTIDYGGCDCEDSPVYVDGNLQPSCSESVSFPNVSANHTLDAQFSSFSTNPMTYTITVSYSDPGSCGGNIDPPGLSATTGPVEEIFTLTEGSSLTFTINYTFPCNSYDSEVYVDGILQSPPSPPLVSFSNVNENHTLQVVFLYDLI